MASTQTPDMTLELKRGYELHKAGRLDEAAATYAQVIASDPGNADALHLLGSIKAQRGAAVEGCRLIEAALKLKPDVALMWFNHGNALAVLERRDEAVESYRRAVGLAPDMVVAHYSLCGQLIAADRAAEALRAMDEALAAMPGQHLLVTGKANALMGLGHHEEALAGFQAAAAASPGNIDALSGRGLALLELARPAEALDSFEQVLALVSGHLDSIIGRAHALVMLGRTGEGMAIMDRVLALVPKNAVANYVRGHAQLAMFDLTQAAESFRIAAELAPEMTVAAHNHADALRALGRYSDAMPIFERVLEKQPGHAHALSGLASSALYCCEWQKLDAIRPAIETMVRNGVRGITPFTFLMLSPSPELHLKCAETFTRFTCPPLRRDAGRSPPKSRPRLKLAYLSSDFRMHATAYLTAELFELHDRSRFEVIGLSGAPGDDSAIRKRIVAAFDQFHDLARSSNAEIDALIRQLDIDILVDLKGHTAQSRIAALASRPAPVQATYLGYPGSSGAPFIDYAIGDAIVTPREQQPVYSEKIVELPGCYQVNDRKRAISTSPMRRQDHHLPEDAFVFCCFNSSFKIDAAFFACWMRMLAAVSGSVLWLLKSNAHAAENLVRQAAAHGIDPARIVFADPKDLPTHLARHRLADLSLDTLPYNAHTTGSDALWAGLPMVTCKGASFSGRVGASLLQAVNMPELVTENLAAYEALAIALAKDRTRLAAIRAKLARNLTTAPLFDTNLFRRHIEAAYTTMHEIALRGEPPRSFAVPPLA